MKKTVFSLAIALSLISASAYGITHERENFDGDWYFTLGNAADPAKDFGCGTEYFNYLTKANSIHNEGPYAIRFKQDSTKWRKVKLPFDFVVDLPFAEGASHSHGYKTVGWKYPETSVGWYRKTFQLPDTDKGKHVSIHFDGIFRNALVWVNGILVGNEPSGYTSQYYDITPYLFYGDDKTNLVCVRADASLEEGWFYEGGGIYRHVWLEKTGKLHVATNGIWAHSELKSDFSSATLYVDAEIENSDHAKSPAYRVEHTVKDKAGNIVAYANSNGTAIAPCGLAKTTTSITVHNPQLWSIDNPYLYRVETKVYVAEKLVDEYTTKTGFRDIRYDKDRGLFLNGKHLKLKGVNCHQDHAGVGSAIPDGLQRYRMERLKWMGANAYRASHNPMTPELLDICDELGILVFEESRLLGINDFEMHVARNMIRRDRNHPCVFLWGIGNEEWGLEWDDRSIDIAKTMTAMCHLADSTRKVAVATSSGPKILMGTDVAGYNYILQNPVEEHRANFPERIALGSEETSGCGTRGIYFADDATGRMPALNRSADKDSTLNRIERGWKFYDERPYLLGLFYWTGFDYRGEPNPMKYPATGSQFGLLDYCGFAKDEAYYLKAWWKPEEPTLHLLPHWNLAGHEGEAIDIWAYSNCDEVELTVNGKPMGRKTMPRNSHLSWTATYEPGFIEAIGYKNGKRVAHERIETTGKAQRIKVEKKVYGNVCIANISLLDKRGRFVPDASLPLDVRVAGNARILGYGNGDSAFRDVERPTDSEAQQLAIKTFNGLAQVIIEVDDDDFSLAVTGNGLKSYSDKK